MMGGRIRQRDFAADVADANVGVDMKAGNAH
jgi:hypothetical protein